MNEEQYADLKAALSANNKEHESYNRRLAEHDQHLDRLDQTYIVLERLTHGMNSLTAGVNDLKGAVHAVEMRVADIEKEPADKWRKITWEVVKAIVLAAAGIAIGRFFMGA